MSSGAGDAADLERLRRIARAADTAIRACVDVLNDDRLRALSARELARAGELAEALRAICIDADAALIEAIDKQIAEQRGGHVEGRATTEIDRLLDHLSRSLPDRATEKE
jgi:hypothetical protein